ncbi:MAG: preprotein translocase subunit SecG [Alphaproteobacteria bacterium]
MQAFLPVLLVIHIIACVALVIAVMLQRSEGGALGMGGGGTGGIISGRGVANVLVRTTMGLAAVFFITSVLMARLNTEAAKAPSAVQKELQNRKTNGFDPSKTSAPVPAPGVPTTSPLTPVPTAPVTTAPAAPVLDPLAAPTTAPTPPAVTTPSKPEPATVTTPAPKPKAKPAEPVKPTTTPATPDTAPATP